jgi:hypothetical protein
MNSLKMTGGRRTAAAVAVFCAATLAVPARAFDDFDIGARPAAFSGAFTAVADDVHSLHYNPAGLSRMVDPQVTAYYAKLLPDLTDGSSASLTFLAYGHPLKKDGSWGTAGLGWTEFRLQNLYVERTLTMGYGTSLPWMGASVGGNFKMLSRAYGEDAYTRNSYGATAGQSDPVFNSGKSKSRPSLDLGGQMMPLPNLSVGASFANINTPDMALSDSDRVPMVTRLGAAYKFPFLKAHVDVSRRRYIKKEIDNRIMAGLERSWLFNRYGEVSVRGGVGVGSRAWRQISLGLGYEVNGIGFDYVYVIPLGSFSDMGNTHRISLSFRFGKTPGEEELASLMREEKEAVARAEEAMRQAQVEAQFVKDDRNSLLEEVERLKAQIAAGAAARTVTPAADRAEESKSRELSARDKAQREFNAAFQAAMAAYSKKVQRGAMLPERVTLLKEIVDKYGDKPVDVSRARTELEKVQSDLAQAQADYKITLDFYRKTVADGADDRQRIGLLERMVRKYGRSGVDVSEVEKELQGLKK